MISLLFLLIILTSCVTITDDEQKFVDKLYKQQTEKITGLVVDLRVRGTEAEEPHTFSEHHISGAKSFDIENDSDFASWIKKLSNNKVTIFIVDSGKGEYIEIVEILKELGYKDIVVYTKGYETLRASEAFTEAIFEGHGIEDCGCE
jgi:rhodanese-related sulfurtransferase